MEDWCKISLGRLLIQRNETNQPRRWSNGLPAATREVVWFQIAKRILLKFFQLPASMLCAFFSPPLARDLKSILMWSTLKSLVVAKA